MEYYGVYDYKESDTFRPTLERRIHSNYPVSKTITTRDDSCCVILSGGGLLMRIRKLVPVECAKLMGFTRDDYEALRSIGQSDAQIYHEMGDSLVVPLFAMLIGQMLPISEDKLKFITENYIEEVKK